MKVLLINGSPREKGCTNLALEETAKALREEGIEAEVLWLGAAGIRDCSACGSCKKARGRCAFDGDPVNPIIRKAMEADGFVFGGPVYYAHPCGQLLSAMDRLFYAGGAAFAHKPAAAVVTARRGGCAASLDAIQKHFTINQMPVVSSTYWNILYGPTPELAQQDEEGLQTMRNLGRNMAWLLKCIQAGKSQGLTPPKAETSSRTNFNRP